MKCEYCDKNFCSKCLNLTNAEYKLFNKRSDLHWYCPPWEEKAMKNIKIEKEIEDRCKEFFSVLLFTHFTCPIIIITLNDGSFPFCHHDILGKTCLDK